MQEDARPRRVGSAVELGAAHAVGGAVAAAAGAAYGAGGGPPLRQRGPLAGVVHVPERVGRVRRVGRNHLYAPEARARSKGGRCKKET